MKTEALKLALEGYMSAFGQALEAHGIELQQQQIEADRIAREALAREQHNHEPDDSDINQVHDGNAHPYLSTAQPEQEPDVYIPSDALRQLKGTSLLILRSVPLYGYRGDGLTPLYTTPPQRNLTDEQIDQIESLMTDLAEAVFYRDVDKVPLIRKQIIEAAHGITSKE